MGLGQLWRSAWTAIRGKPGAAPPGFGEISKAASMRGSALARSAWGVALVIGLLSILGYAASGDPSTFLRIASLGLLVGGGGFGAGTLLGFIFGVPRTGYSSARFGRDDKGADGDEAESRQSEYRGNTNLEQISDWLTKILVGVSLTQAHEIAVTVHRLVEFLAPAFVVSRDTASAKSFVLSLLVFAPICGFLLGYILTRIYFALALRQADVALSLAVFRPTIDQQVDQLRRTAGVPGLASAPLEAQREQVGVLAQAYEQIWSSMPSGDERTQRMELVAAQMRTLALSAGDELLRVLMSSISPGERLAAITILQVRPRPDMVDWLADRVASEKHFIGYQAALALLYAARVATGAGDTGRMLDAVYKARASLGPELALSDRARVLDEAERLLLR